MVNAERLPEQALVVHHVKRATAADLAAVTRLLYEYFDVIGVQLRDDADAIDTFLRDPACGLWLAYVDGVAAGCIALRPLPELAEQHGAECKRLYVAPAFRRRGLAELMLAELEAFALVAGYRAVYLDSKDDLHAAIALYQRQGYRQCPRYNDNPQATVFMRKALV
jgi:ribosomal protein S18 acetylase RimI-like enzyme